MFRSRVDETVSGRMAPMPPVPLAVTGLSNAIVLKLRLKVEAETVAIIVVADAVAPCPAIAATRAVRATDADPIVLALAEIFILSPLHCVKEKCEASTDVRLAGLNSCSAFIARRTAARQGDAPT
jgi:hypothetical protein